MDVTIETGLHGSACFEDAKRVRVVVFMEEQGYENEFDAIDEDERCLHVTLRVDGEVAGCARMFPELLERSLAPEAPCSPVCALDVHVPAERVYLLGRVAVLPAWRRRGLASEIVRACDAVARDAGALVMKLHAQEYVQGLYASCGYEAIGPVDYEDEGQPHIWMARAL